MAQMHLTEIVLRALKGSEKYETIYDSTTPGFGIRVGKRSKTFVVVRGRNRERISIGRYPDISLSDARKEAKRLLSNEPEAKTGKLTYIDARDEFLRENYKDSKSDWPAIAGQLLRKHFKRLEGKQLTELTDTHIQDCLDAIEKPSARLHAFRVMRTFLKWTTKPPRRYLKHSPMEGYEAPGSDRKGTRILSDDELAAVWKAAHTGSRLVFRLLILWGTRSAETTRTRQEWAIDDVLTIPGEHTKNGRDHAVPVLPLAKTVLEAAPSDGTHYFPGQKDGKPLAPGSLHQLRRDIQKESGTSDWQARDLRRTFRSNMARLKVPRDVCEVLINHAPPVLDEIYDRYDRLDEKREALAKYEAFLLRLLSPRA